MANKTNRNGGETANNKTRVLLYDVETSPNLAYIWGKYEQDALGDFVKERQIISIAWKWLGVSKIECLALPMLKSYKLDPGNNLELIEKFHAVMSQADIAIAHNIDEFDDKMVNTDMIKHGLRPLPPHLTVDTLRVARSKFRFNSNKLNDLGAFLKCGKKVKHWGFELWSRCMAGDPVAWKLMMRYNKGDVSLLEKVYLKLRPWMTKHPDMNALDGRDACPVCKSRNMKKQGFKIVAGGKKQNFQCRDCGRWSIGAFVPKTDTWKFR